MGIPDRYNLFNNSELDYYDPNKNLPATIVYDDKVLECKIRL